MTSPTPWARTRLWAGMAVAAAGAVIAAGAVMAQAPADTPTNPFVNDAAAARAGQALYDGACVACHGPAASGGRGPALNTGRFSRGDQDYDVFKTIHDGIPAGGMPSFAAMPANDIWRIVTYLRSLSGRAAPAPVAAGAASDPAAIARGEQVFFGSGGCSGCHEVNGRGLDLASDLSGAAGLGAAAIRDGVAHKPRPPARGAPRAVNVVLNSGATLEGMVRAEDAFNLLMVDRKGDLQRLDRRNIRSVATNFNFAPAGIDQRLGAGPVNDVVAYLSAQRGRNVSGAIQPSRAGGVTPQRLLAADKEPQNWLTYWGNYNGHHFSELTQVTKANVGGLQARWAAQLPGSSLLQSTPIVVDGVMYVSGPPGDLYALDAATGLQLWKFTRKQDVVNPYQINPANRGVAVLGGRVFLTTLDNLLIAIDARTGRELWERRVANTLEGYELTGAPLAVGDKIVIGVGCGEFPTRGFLEAYSPVDGKRIWRFETIPQPPMPEAKTWLGDTWKYGGGGTWLTGTYDHELKTLYWAVGNPAPSFNAEIRKGDNLWTNSVVALDPETGKLKWHYQFTPNDSHDWDSVQDMILADQVIDGRPRKLLLHADRNAHFYVLDRTNGQFINAWPFATQNWADGFDRNGRPIVRPESIATPEGSVVFPSPGGATNFQAPSYDARSNVLFLASQDSEGYASYSPAEIIPGRLYTGARQTPRPTPSRWENKAMIKALDTRTGKTLWDFPITQGSLQAGVLGTRGGVVFAATPEGSFVGLDMANGQPLWRFRTGGRISASPMSYAVDGQQFIAISAGNIVYSFALPQTRTGR